MLNSERSAFRPAFRRSHLGSRDAGPLVLCGAVPLGERALLPGQQLDAAISGRGDHTVLPGQQPDVAISGRGDQTVLPGQQPVAAISGRGDHTVLPGQQPDTAISGRAEQSQSESALCFLARSRKSNSAERVLCFRAELGLSSCKEQSHSGSTLCPPPGVVCKFMFRSQVMLGVV
jgi:hypothetical protein